jgi:DNA modification methylase
VWDIRTRPNRAAAGHFATFRLELAERCIRITSDPDDLVLDPFLGSGTTALAAGGLGRRFLGIELNPDFFEMSRGRLLEEGFRQIEDPTASEGTIRVAVEGNAFFSVSLISRA